MRANRKRVLPAIAGLSLLGFATGAIAAKQFNPASTQTALFSQEPKTSSIILAQWDEYHWHHHHPPNYTLNPNDYNWGGRYRYQYPPGWFNGPPSGWAMTQRREYLQQRREVAINMQQQMLARGDTKAAERLGGVIGQLNRELGYR